MIYRNTFILLLLIISSGAFAQDSIHHEKIGFREILIIDNQTVFVPEKKSFEVELQQRFGTITNGLKDIYGLFASPNTRVGAYYVPVNRLLLGVGLTKEEMQLGVEAKYNLVKQSRIPFSISYFLNASIKMGGDEHLTYRDRLSFFHQVLVARQFSDRVLLQVAPSLSHFNRIAVDGVEAEHVDTSIFNHVAVSLLGQYRINKSFSLIAEFDQPLTDHERNMPYPNVSFGFQLMKGNYCFQLFAENFQSIDAQSSNMFNRNSFAKGQFLFGFNISRSFHFGNHVGNLSR